MPASTRAGSRRSRAERRPQSTGWSTGRSPLCRAAGGSAPLPRRSEVSRRWCSEPARPATRRCGSSSGRAEQPRRWRAPRRRALKRLRRARDTGGQGVGRSTGANRGASGPAPVGPQRPVPRCRRRRSLAASRRRRALDQRRRPPRAPSEPARRSTSTGVLHGADVLAALPSGAVPGEASDLAREALLPLPAPDAVAGGACRPARQAGSAGRYKARLEAEHLLRYDASGAYSTKAGIAASSDPLFDAVWRQGDPDPDGRHHRAGPARPLLAGRGRPQPGRGHRLGATMVAHVAGVRGRGPLGRSGGGVGLDAGSDRPRPARGHRPGSGRRRGHRDRPCAPVDRDRHRARRGRGHVPGRREPARPPRRRRDRRGDAGQPRASGRGRRIARPARRHPGRCSPCAARPAGARRAGQGRRRHSHPAHPRRPAPSARGGRVAGAAGPAARHVRPRARSRLRGRGRAAAAGGNTRLSTVGGPDAPPAAVQRPDASAAAAGRRREPAGGRRRRRQGRRGRPRRHDQSRRRLPAARPRRRVPRGVRHRREPARRAARHGAGRPRRRRSRVGARAGPSGARRCAAGRGSRARAGDRWPRSPSGMVAADAAARAGGRLEPGEESALSALLRAVDTTLWTVDTVAGAGSAEVAAIVGRPVAVVRAVLELDVADDVDALTLDADAAGRPRRRVRRAGPGRSRGAARRDHPARRRPAGLVPRRRLGTRPPGRPCRRRPRT